MINYLFQVDILIFCYRSGGVELFCDHGKIKVVNTLEARLEMMSQQVYQKVIITI